MASFFLTSAAKGRRVILWSLACFAISQLALSIYLDKRRLEVRDPAYGVRLHSLQARLAEYPNAPMILILGSSRVKYGVWPGAMKVRTCSGEPPFIYNFGFDALGHIRALMYLRRLLADGIRPDFLLVEVWPPLWTEGGMFREARQVPLVDDLHWRDVPLVCRYFFDEPDLMRLGVLKSLLPISAYRSQLLESNVRFLLPRRQADEMAQRLHDWRPCDGSGWFPIPEAWRVSTPQRRRRLDREMEQVELLLDPLVVNPRSDAALRELLEECRRRRIRAALILLPEHSRTRSWYTPQVRALVRDYLGRLQQEFRVPVVDVRTWVRDEDFAVDYYHLQPQSVPQFSERLGREVVQPLLLGTPLDSRVLFVEDAPQKEERQGMKDEKEQF